MGGGILTFNDTLDEVKSRKRTLVMWGSYSTDDTNQSISRQTNQFYQFRKREDLTDIDPDHYFHDEGITGGRKGRNGREEWHRLVRLIRSSRRKFIIWVADIQRFRDWAQFVGFWDEFLRDNDRVQLYIDDDNMLISHHMTRNQQGMLMLMAWQAEVHLEEQSKKTKSGISAYRANNPDKGWGRPRDTSTDHMLRVLMENQMLNEGKVNWSELSREIGKSRAKLKSDAQELGLLD
jgi:DNA invertase Pin-like site-specific DNA recombinase